MNETEKESIKKNAFRKHSKAFLEWEKTIKSGKGRNLREIYEDSPSLADYLITETTASRDRESREEVENHDEEIEMKNNNILEIQRGRDCMLDIIRSIQSLIGIQYDGLKRIQEELK